VRAVDLRRAVAILIAITGVSLAVDSANAETAALAEREAPDTADSGTRDATPTAGRAEQRRERRELRSQQGEERLAHARVVLFEGIEDGSFFYFVHSYYVEADDAQDTLATTDYGLDYTSIAGRDSVFGVQFHPEKSQEIGLKIFRNFGDL